MIYLKLCRNQDQEWSPVTISSLAKMLVGVNNIVVENQGNRMKKSVKFVKNNT